MRPDSNGRIAISIPHPDPNGALDYTDVLVVVAVTHGPGADTGLEITDAARPLAGAIVGGNVTLAYTDPTPDVDVGTLNWGGAVFSDDARAASSYTTSTRNWGRFSSTGNRNEVTLTLLDQYGDGYRGTSSTSYRFTVTPERGDTAVAGNVASNGRARVVYTSPASVRSEEASDSVIAVESSTNNADFAVVDPAVTAEAPVLSIYWAEPGSAATGTAIVRVADPAARSIVIEGGEDDPEYYVFGTDDTFIVGTTALSFAQFTEVLNAANNSSIAEITISTADGSETMLEWSGYDAARPRDRAKWTLTAVCSVVVASA